MGYPYVPICLFSSLAAIRGCTFCSGLRVSFFSMTAPKLTLPLRNSSPSVESLIWFRRIWGTVVGAAIGRIVVFGVYIGVPLIFGKLPSSRAQIDLLDHLPVPWHGKGKSLSIENERIYGIQNAIVSCRGCAEQMCSHQLGSYTIHGLGSTLSVPRFRDFGSVGR